ncbi:MAG: hypothetical protein MUP85_19505 [Candidatus Lokiarchaeota archaeon]|nr:hypothetical protein [Candidatus Lokiarchaeota archaeon]
MSIENILFVCTGNTARSPAAEYLARYHAKKYGTDLKFQSAGFINAFTYMQPESREYLNRKDINHSDFIPQLINSNLLENNDLIITMEWSHKDEIVHSYPLIKNLAEKTHTLKEFNGAKEDLDIIDPYYTNRNTYQKIMELIDNQTKILILKIMKMNKNSS